VEYFLFQAQAYDFGRRWNNKASDFQNIPWFSNAREYSCGAAARCGAIQQYRANSTARMAYSKLYNN